MSINRPAGLQLDLFDFITASPPSWPRLPACSRLRAERVVMITKSVLFVCLGFVGVSPVFAQSAAERQLAADIRMLEQRAERIEGAISELTQSVEGLRKQLAEQANATLKLSADQRVVIDEALATVGVLREQVAETNRRLATIVDKSAASGDATPMFESARADYMVGNYPLAVQGFTEVLEDLTSRKQRSPRGVLTSARRIVSIASPMRRWRHMTG